MGYAVSDMVLNKETAGWSRDEVDSQIFSHYAKTEANFSSFDRRSLMLYAVPNQLTLGHYEVGWNTKLSSSARVRCKACRPWSADQ